MFKINRLQDWVPVEGRVQFIGLENRTIKMEVNAEVLTTVFVQWLDVDGKAIEGREKFIGAFQGLEKFEFTTEGNIHVVFVAPKGKQVWYLDNREAVAEDAPVGESFTRFEKRGMSSPDPIALALHKQSVLNRLQGADADRATAAYVSRLEDRLMQIEEERASEKAARDGVVNAGKSAPAETSAADDKQGADVKA